MPENKRREADRLATWQKIISDLRFMLPLVITLLGGTVYGNDIAGVKTWIHNKGGVVEADGHTEVGGVTFEESVIRNSEETRAELLETDAEIRKLWQAIKKLKAWHE